MTDAASLPLVSIITVVYNGERYIENTMASVLNQTYKNIEYIVIDGGSQDQTVALIKKYEDRLAYWCTEKDRGISHAFNKGLEKAGGTIIGLINADDWYETGTVETVVQRIGSHDVLYGDLAYWEQDKKRYVQKADHHLLDLEMSINHPTVFIKKSCYERFGFFDESLTCAMDYELLLRLKSNGCSFLYMPVVLANMRLEGISDRQWYTACRETLSVKNKYLKNRILLNGLYFVKQATAISLARLFKKIGLYRLVRFYRGRFSLLKKQYN